MKTLFLVVAVLVVVALAESDGQSDSTNKDALAEVEKKMGKKIENFSVKELNSLLRERGVKCTGCSEKSHVLEKVRENIHLPVKVEQGTNSRKSRGRASDPKNDKDIDDLLAKLKKMPGGDKFKIFTPNDLDKLKDGKMDL
mmetsp:Transcript_78019/g.210138  ORF Transcript_78019/g.210138 Transcript_78019/m.210138 type:complete len:141 (+) Transcript_78019:72-494(+)